MAFHEYGSAAPVHGGLRPVRASAGQLMVSSRMLASPGQALSEAAVTSEVPALARGGILLAARGY